MQVRGGLTAAALSAWLGLAAHGAALNEIYVDFAIRTDAEPVLDAMSTVSFKPFELALDGMGRFGDLWWAGMKDSVPLTAVVRRIRRALAEQEIPFDRKRFSPHITLIRKVSGELPGVHPKPAAMTVDTISLMRSNRGRNGMIYTELGTLEAEH